MKQQQVDRFKSKFRLLNSQESSEEIIWSCSDSSDYENSSYNELNIKPIKRKRRQSKKNTSKNISNLDITFIDKNNDKPPENSNFHCFSDLSNIGCKSPILTSSQRYFAPFKVSKSPVLLNNTKENKLTSPVLILKNSVQKFSPKVRKKLFECNKSVNIETKKERSVSPVLTCTQKVLKHCVTSDQQNQSITNIDRQKVIDKQRNNTQEFNIKCTETKYEIHKNINQFEKQIPYTDYQEQNNEDDFDDTSSIKSVALIEKVKSYFDSHFSSTTPSQHSISEYESKSSPKSNDDIEIVNSSIEVKNTSTIKIENTSAESLKSFDNFYGQKTKKVRYKKDGLSYRLSALLKKQNASTSLWYHERFLAANSNFVLPKEEFLAFRIGKVNFKYGCYLLNVLDVDNERCFIFINNLYVKSNSMQEDAVFKLYKPFKILELDGYKLIINVYKYECLLLKK